MEVSSEDPPFAELRSMALRSWMMSGSQLGSGKRSMEAMQVYFFLASKVISIWDPATRFEMATQVRAGKTP